MHQLVSVKESWLTCQLVYTETWSVWQLTKKNIEKEVGPAAISEVKGA